MDICGADHVLDERFHAEFGSSSETTFQTLQRGYKGLTNRLYNLVKKEYEESDITRRLEGTEYFARSFKLRNSKDNVQLACCFCERQGAPSSRIVIFLHTNMRNLLQGLEILPLCSDLQASLLCFDLRGCGKSDGQGLQNLDTHLSDLDLAIAWAQSRARGHSTSTAALAGLAQTTQQPSPVEIIVWARGMSCATAIYHAAGKPSSYPVKCLALDSPYTSIEEMVDAGFSRLRADGFFLPTTVLRVGASLVRSSLSSKLSGMDPFHVRPIDVAKECAVPCCVLIATDDDYVPVDQGLEVASRWLGPVQAKQFVGRHFDERQQQDFAWIAGRMRVFLHQQGLPPEPAPKQEEEQEPQSEPEPGPHAPL